MTHHRVKARTGVFQAYADGIKPWSMRLNDRQYQPGDTFSVYEWHQGEETGREAGPWSIISVWNHFDWIPSDHVVLSLGDDERHRSLVGREPGKCSDCGAHFPGMMHADGCQYYCRRTGAV